MKHSKRKSRLWPPGTTPRLAFDPKAEGTEKKIFQGEFQFNEIFTGWWPQQIDRRQLLRHQQTKH